MGLGKPRSKLGKYIDKHKISQEWLVKQSGLSRNAITRLCDGERDDEKLRVTSKSQVISALRRNGHHVMSDDFW